MLQLAALVVLRDPGRLADLVKRPLVGDGVDALADRELPEVVLPLNLVFTAELLGGTSWPL